MNAAQVAGTSSSNNASHTKRVTAPDGTWVEYNYDGLERMVSRQTNAGVVTLLFHQGMSEQIAVETNAAGTVTTRYLVDAYDMARGKLDIGNSTGRVYYITDPRGNVTQLVGYIDHTIKAVFAYDPYGKDKTALTKRLTANWDSRLKFQMSPQDSKTKNYSLGARQMDPKINRFVGADMYLSAGANIGLQIDPLTGNRYLYAGANPIGLIDDGHGPCIFGHVGDNNSACRTWKQERERSAKQLKALPSTIKKGPKELKTVFVKSAEKHPWSFSGTVCYAACASVGPNMVRPQFAGFEPIGPSKVAKAKPAREGFGYSVETWIPLSDSKPDGTQRSVEGCFGICLGYYRNGDGTYGAIVGGGSTGFVFDPFEGP